MVKLRFSPFLFATMVVLGCTGSEPAADDDEVVRGTSEAIQGGTEDQTHSYEVGVCVGGLGNADCPYICTGTLIAPNLVVTARHCVQGVPHPERVSCTDQFGDPLGSARVTTYYKLAQTAYGWHPVKKIYVPEGDTVCGNDIALLILSANVSSTEAKPATPGVRYSLTNTNNNFKQVTAIGYGKTAVDAGDSGIRRILQNIPIECVPGSSTMSCGNLAGRMTTNEFATGDGTCAGDSGSGALEQTSFSQGSPLVLGVLSRGGEDGNTCVGGVYTRLDVWRDFIVGVAEEAVRSGGYARPDWMAPLDPDQGGGDGGTTTLLPMGAVCHADGDCNTNTCATGTTGFKVCTSACAQGTNACPGGYSCQSNMCFQDQKAPAPVPTKANGCICDLTEQRGGSTSWTWFGLASLALLAGVLRRRSSH